MKLAIYETTHHETLPSILDLSEGRFREVTVFIKEAYYPFLCGAQRPEEKWPHVRFQLQEETCSNRCFIKRMFRHLRKNGYTHFHISTLDNNLLYMAAQLFLTGRNIQVSLSVQAVNEYTSYKFGNIRNLTEFIAKLYLHKRIRSYRVFFPGMIPLLAAKLPEAVIKFIPSRFYNGDLRPGNDFLPGSESRAYFKIVLPGSIDPKRRDYEFVVNFFRAFPTGHPVSRNIELVLLGNGNTGSYAKHIIRSLKELESGSLRITAYNSYVPQQEYERQLADADIIWSPLQLKTQGIRKTAEVYGVSMATGAMADLLLNNAPCLVPSGFQAPEKYEAALISYRSAPELMRLLAGFMNDPGALAALNKNIGDAFKFFRKDNFIPSFNELHPVV